MLEYMNNIPFKTYTEKTQMEDHIHVLEVKSDLVIFLYLIKYT